MRYAAWQRWHRCGLVGQMFTWFLLRASGGSHLLEISRSRWPQAPRGVQPYHRANLSDRWVYYCTLAHKSPSIEVRREKSPSEASQLLFCSPPSLQSHTLSVWCCVKPWTQSWEILTGCQVSEEVWEVSLCIRGAESLMSRLLARLAAFDASFGCVTAPSTLSGVDVITLMFVSVGESGCVQTGIQVNMSICYLICNSILHSVKVNCQIIS